MANDINNEVSSTNSSFIDSGCESEASTPRKAVSKPKEETATSSSQRQISTEQFKSSAELTSSRAPSSSAKLVEDISKDIMRVIKEFFILDFSTADQHVVVIMN